MYGANNTKIYLTNVEWSKNYKDVMYFETKEDQFNWFRYNPKTNSSLSSDSYRFIDGDGNSIQHNIKIEMKPEEAQGYNYLFYQNDGGDWVYCFVDSVDFVNYETSLFHISEDIMQTYRFKYDVSVRSIERQTSKNDTVDDSILENRIYDTGNDYVRSIKDIFPNPDYYPYCYCTKFIGKGSTESEYHTYSWNYTNIDGLALEGAIIVFRNNSDMLSFKAYHDTSTNFNAKDNLLNFGFVSKAVVPNPCVIINDKAYPFIDIGGINTSYQSVYWSEIDRVESCDISRPTSLKLRNGSFYYPRNNVMLRNPYLYCAVETNGTKKEYDFDLFADTSKATFDIKYTYSDTFHCYISPHNYRGNTGFDYQEAVEIPVACSIPTYFDSYNTWMNQNTASITAQNDNYLISTICNAISALPNMIGSGVSGGIAGFTSSAINYASSEIGGALQYENNLEAMYETAKNTRSYIVTGSFGTPIFQVTQHLNPRLVVYQIDGDIVVDIDKFYSIYGYKVNTSKAINLNNPNWNYIHTKDCNIIPTGSSFMNAITKIQIESLYNSGIRFWHTYKKKNGEGVYEWNFNNILEYGDYINKE